MRVDALGFFIECDCGQKQTMAVDPARGQYGPLYEANCAGCGARIQVRIVPTPNGTVQVFCHEIEDPRVGEGPPIHVVEPSPTRMEVLMEEDSNEEG